MKKTTSKILNKIFPKKGFATPSEVEKAEQTFYINYLCEGMTVFDVGANIGELSLLFSRFVGKTGQVHAFEASQSTFEKLTTICTLANRSQIILNNKAVSDQEGILKLHVYDDDHSGWNSLANRPLEKYGIKVTPMYIEEVKATTIDDYCTQNNILYIDLLKIDVEGAEYQVLRGANNMLKNHQVKCCVFEFGQTTFDMGNNPNDIENYLKQLGYSVRNIVKDNPVFPGRSSTENARFSVHVATLR
ncbi:MAG: FkbM family methyltransferase [Gomphosphaeria aponina SAG 52.96 = DSM 107014]|uniref:FkbM family methyltransferase n=1 Tax=Gomphosphaeria aponina SAG 52.96 = DSM 107014 TaxID=1521640 RepID=A0A941GQ78_9CHRO|nr:FkbM family methyltransferase [Gomphosphaeria aponina SAG 52.96 = DSM 107014]